MGEHHVILIIAVVVLLYGYISEALAKLNISGPMIFTGFGLLVSPLVFNLTQIEANTEFVTVIVEMTLVLVLFSDAALLDLKLLKQSWNIPARLLFISLPLSIVLGTLVAVSVFPDQPMLYMILLALLLTPTDAALGKAVVFDSKVPKEIRSSINVESGLNDGIVFPIVLTVVAMTVSGLTETNNSFWPLYVVQQIVFGASAGAGIGFLGAKLVIFVAKHNWMESDYRNLIPIALAILSFYLAESVGGNGFIAAFFAGLYAGNTSQKTRDNIEDFAESEGELFVLISFIIFGIAFVPKTIEFITLEVIVYALFSLTLVRMLPVMISLIGTKLDYSTRLFIAWFGPRGIASILYVLIVAHEMESLAGFDTIYAVVTVTVLFSIFAHGLSAQPLVNLYARFTKK